MTKKAVFLVLLVLLFVSASFMSCLIFGLLSIRAVEPFCSPFFASAERPASLSF